MAASFNLDRAGLGLANRFHAFPVAIRQGRAGQSPSGTEREIALKPGRVDFSMIEIGKAGK